MKRVAIIVAVMVCTSVAQAVVIREFPGLEALIAESDAIVVLRIDRHVDLSSLGDAYYSTHDCYVYQTLKGDVPANRTVRLQLMDTSGSFANPFALHSSHLVFLARSESNESPIGFVTINVRGANIRLPAMGLDRVPAGETVGAKIERLLRRALRQNKQDYEREEAFLKQMVDSRRTVGEDPAEAHGRGGSSSSTESGGRVYRPGDPGVGLPVITRQTMPAYTEEAMNALRQGKVILNCVIRTTGRVTNCEIQRGLGFGLDANARREIQENWRFRPATLNGKAIDVYARIEVEFALGLGDPADALTPEEAEHLIVGSIAIIGPEKATRIARTLIKTLDARPFDSLTFLADRERLRRSDRVLLVEANLYRNQVGGVTVQFKVEPK